MIPNQHHRVEFLQPHRVLVSAENTPYAAWQAKLITFSCVDRLGHAPIVVVHDAENAALHPYFDEIAGVGSLVHRAPNYRITKHGDLYLPRNTAGTLLEAAAIAQDLAEHFVLCDPDIIFVRPPRFPCDLSGEYCSYLDYNRSDVKAAAHVLDISPALLDSEQASVRCGVPYVIPTRHCLAFARSWLEAIDAFPPPRANLEGYSLTHCMYGFGLAAIKLGLDVARTNMATTNYTPATPCTADVIHYCYGNSEWDKRHYFTDAAIDDVWEPTAVAPAGSVLGEIQQQIRDSRTFFHLQMTKPDPWLKTNDPAG